MTNNFEALLAPVYEKAKAWSKTPWDIPQGVVLTMDVKDQFDPFGVYITCLNAAMEDTLPDWSYKIVKNVANGEPSIVLLQKQG